MQTELIHQAVHRLEDCYAIALVTAFLLFLWCADTLQIPPERFRFWKSKGFSGVGCACTGLVWGNRNITQSLAYYLRLRLYLFTIHFHRRTALNLKQNVLA